MELQQSCNAILEEDDNYDESQHNIKKLEEIHFIMIQHIMKNIMTYLQPLLKCKEVDKRFHRWFALFFYPYYVMSLHYVK